MARRYLAFDIETAEVLPDPCPDWRPHRPLGIACAATLAAGAEAPTLWHGRGADGSPAGRMTPQEAAELVGHLAARAAEGWTILTWNGLGFDFDILAEESHLPAECRRLARGHVDMMFHVLCELGHPLSLAAAAEGMGLAGKTEGMSGVLAPQLWAAGEHRRVLDYVAGDVRATLGLASACEAGRCLRWTSRSGRRRRMALPGGWLTVEGALRLPEPDTSWMSNPLRRDQLAAWL